MRWGKIVLIVQAAATLVLGMVFLSQLLSIDGDATQQLKTELEKGSEMWGENAPPIVVDITQRYTIAAYVLLVVAIMELVLITRVAG